jgi:hypothetical protein
MCFDFRHLDVTTEFNAGIGTTSVLRVPIGSFIIYGPNLWVVLMLMALLVPALIVYLRTHHWQFGLRTLGATVTIAALCCAFARDDLLHIDELWFGITHRPAFYVGWTLIPGALLASLSLTLSVAIARCLRKRKVTATNGTVAGRFATQLDARGGLLKMVRDSRGRTA